MEEKEVEVEVEYKSRVERFNKMQAPKRKSSRIILMAVLVVCVFALIAIISMPDEYDRERIRWAIESKEQIYNIYKNNTKDIINSNKVEDNVSIADSSRVAIFFAIKSFDEYHRNQITKKGNDKLNVVIEEATKSLNNAIPIVLNSENLSYEDYKTIRRGIDDEVVSNYISDENKKIYHSIKDNYRYDEKSEASKKKEEERKQQEQSNEMKNALQSVLKTGMSESEVRSITGSPNKIFRNDEAEFWQYGDLVLTMKNGYVFGINSN